MTLRRAAALSVGKGVVASYVHNAVSDGLGKIGVLVALESTGDDATSSPRSAGRWRCTSPPPIRRRSIPPGSIRRRSQREKDVLAEKAKAAGQARERHREDRRSPACKTSTRRSACSIRPSSTTTRRASAQALKEAEGKVGAPIKVTGFVRYALGEGIEKQETDFAAEVAAATASSPAEHGTCTRGTCRASLIARTLGGRGRQAQWRRQPSIGPPTDA